jgi:hypothetical protein
LLGLSAVAVTAALVPRAAAATHGWCRTDPIVRIGGQTADILLSSHLEMRQLATGPARVVVTVPTGVPARLIATDPGFGGNGYDVRFEESGRLDDDGQVLEVLIDVYAPALDGAHGALPVRVTFTPRGDGRLVPGQALGLANEWVTLRSPAGTPSSRAMQGARPTSR